MPHSPVHQQKLKKNLAVLGIIIGLCAILFAITIIKMGPMSHSY